MFVESYTTEDGLDSAFNAPPVEELTEAEFLQIKGGRFVVSSVERILAIPSDAILTAAARFEMQGGRPDLEWGICNTIDHWIVKMPHFSKAWPGDIQPYIALELGKVKPLPRNIKVDELVNLEGIYRLSELESHLPLSPVNIKCQVDKIGCASRKVMGCWKNDASFLVDMQCFLRWMIGFKYC